MAIAALLASDDRRSELVIQGYLLDAGYTVATVPYKSLLSFPSFETRTVIVVDVSRGSLSTVKDVEAVREKGILAPIVVLASSFDDDARQALGSLPDVRTRVKPIAKDELIRSIGEPIVQAPPASSFLDVAEQVIAAGREEQVLATKPDNRTLAPGEVSQQDLVWIGQAIETQCHGGVFLLELIRCRRGNSLVEDKYWRLQRSDGGMLPSLVRFEVYRKHKHALASISKYQHRGKPPQQKQPKKEKRKQQKASHGFGDFEVVGRGEPTGKTTDSGTEVYLYELRCQHCQQVFTRELPKGTAAYRGRLCTPCYKQRMDVEYRDRANALELPDFDEGTVLQRASALRIRHHFIEDSLKKLRAAPDNDLQDRLLCEVSERTDAKWWVTQFKSGTLAEQFTLTRSACSSPP